MTDIDWAAEVTGTETPVPEIDWADEVSRSIPESGPMKTEKGPGLGFLARGQMAMLADTAAEADVVLKRFFPEGSIRRSGNDLFFNTKKGEPFRKVDPSILSDPGARADLPGDVADFLGALIPTTSAELVGFGLTGTSPAGKAFSIARNTGRAMGFGAAGEMARQGIQTMTGSQREPFETQRGRATAEGLLSGAGETASKPLGVLVNAVRGATNIALEEGAREAMKAASKLGLPKFTPGQVARSPVVTKLEKQAAAVSGESASRIKEQQSAALSLLRRQGLTKGGDVIRRLSTEIEKKTRNIIARLKASPLDSSQTGKALQNAIKTWDTQAEHLVNLRYAHARSLASAQYDVSGIKAAAEAIETGRRTATIDEGSFRSEGELTGEMAKIVADIKIMNPDLPDLGAGDATDQLMAMRKRLYDLKEPPHGEIRRQEHKEAARLYHAISDAMDSPIVDQDNARQAWKEAAAEAKKRFDVWDLAIIKQVNRSEVPAEMVHQLFQPNKVDSINNIKNVVAPAEFKKFQDFAAGEVIRKPSLLSSMDEETLVATFGRNKLQVLTDVVDDLNLLRADKFKELTNQGLRKHKIIQTFMSDVTPAQVDAFIKNTPGEFKKDVRASLIDEAVRLGSESKAPGKVLKQFIARWEDNGLVRMWGAKEWRTLKSLSRYLDRVDSTADTGTSLVAAQRVGEITGGDITSATNAAISILHLVGVGRLMESSVVQRLLLGEGRLPASLGGLKALTAALVSGANNTVATDEGERDGP